IANFDLLGPLETAELALGWTAEGGCPYTALGVGGRGRPPHTNRFVPALLLPQKKTGHRLRGVPPTTNFSYLFSLSECGDTAPNSLRCITGRAALAAAAAAGP